MICTARRKSALLATNNRMNKITDRRNFILKEDGEVYADRNAFLDSRHEKAGLGDLFSKRGGASVN